MRCGVFYVYDGDGNIVRSIDIQAKKEYNYEYEEGRIIRATEGKMTKMVLKAVFPEVPIAVDSSCSAGVTVESHNTALNAMKAVQIEII